MTDPGALGPSEQQAYYNGLADGRRDAERLRAENQILHSLITTDAALIERYNAAMERYNLGNKKR